MRATEIDNLQMDASKSHSGTGSRQSTVRVCSAAPRSSPLSHGETGLLPRYLTLGACLHTQLLRLASANRSPHHPHCPCGNPSAPQAWLGLPNWQQNSPPRTTYGSILSHFGCHMLPQLLEKMWVGGVSAGVTCGLPWLLTIYRA